MGNLFQIRDKAAAVTGSGRGIGAATAVALAEAGADAVIASRTEKDPTKVAAPFMQETGGGAIVNMATILHLAPPAGACANGKIIDVGGGSQLPPVGLWPSDL
ncbi:SDR family NAD(P)-dependent oxidoreductase [Streptomyces bottropensis]|uniref:SDR family NAD(P)-dependent oxidoreductase n=1 Tax=Streptomyces bottropensis TaxID=42235 RepID=A0ABU8AYZ2_9ACTN